MDRTDSTYMYVQFNSISLQTQDILLWFFNIYNLIDIFEPQTTAARYFQKYETKL